MSMPSKSILTKIQLVVFDVDGVLTDGTLFYGGYGESIKLFNVKDGVGFKLLHFHNIATGIITAKSSPAIYKRIDDLKIAHSYVGCRDKLAAMAALQRTLNLDSSQIAYVGDDINDLAVMKSVGLSISPADGYLLVKQQADIITQSKGGRGVAREVADLLISTRWDLSEAYEQFMVGQT